MDEGKKWPGNPRLTVRFTPDEIAQIRRLAKVAKVTTADIIRGAVQEILPKRIERDAA